MTEFKQLVIIYRSCDRVDACSGKPRTKPKKEVIKRCYNSLMSSINFYKEENPNPIKIWMIVVDDMSSEDTIEHLKSASVVPTQFNTSVSPLGNGGSLHKCYELADGLSEDTLIFFLEDDYLMDVTCINEMIHLHQVILPKIGQPLGISHPVDYIDRYTKSYPSYIVLGLSLHWRTIKHTTGTFCIPKPAFTTCRVNYDKFTFYGERPEISEDNSINLTYNKYPCFSPMPSLAHHFQYESTYSPFLSVESLWESNE